MVRALKKITKAGMPEKICYGNTYPKYVLFNRADIDLNKNIKTSMLIIKLISNGYKNFGKPPFSSGFPYNVL